MKRFLSLIFLIPITILVVALAVANRDPVALSLPSELKYDPIQVPLFALLFVTLLFGMLLGSFATWCKQHKFRKQARIKSAEAKNMMGEVEKQKKRADDLVAESVDEISSEQKAFSALGLPAPQKA